MGVFSVLRPILLIAALASLSGLLTMPASAHDDLETPELLRGDSNDDGLVDLSDGIHLLEYLFLGGDSASHRYHLPLAIGEAR